MANNIFSEAKAYTKKHPRTTYQEAIKIVSKKRKPVKKGVAVGKVKSKPLSIKVKRTKRGVSMSIGAVSIREITRQQDYLKGLEHVKNSTQTMLKDNRYKTEHGILKKQLEKTNRQISDVKKHITALKRGI
jgi:hypothetical protein